MFLKKCASEIWKASKKGRRGNKRPTTDLREHTSKKLRGNLPELLNTTFMVVIRRMSNGKDIVLSPNQLQAMYNDVRHWKELIVFIYNNRRPNAPYILKWRFKCALEQDTLDD